MRITPKISTYFLIKISLHISSYSGSRSIIVRYQNYYLSDHFLDCHT